MAGALVLAAGLAAGAHAQWGPAPVVIKDFAPGPDPVLKAASHGPRQGLAHQGRYYFEGSSAPTYPDGPGGMSIYPGMLVATDGSWFGTLPVKTADNIRLLGTLGGRVVFADSDFGEETGRRINVTDGSAKNTRELRLLTGAVEVNPGVEAGGAYLFHVRFGDGRGELWRTDGTVEGTTEAGGLLLPAGYSPDPAAPMVRWGTGEAVTLARDAAGRRNLVILDGSPGGTRRVLADAFLDAFGAPEDFAVAGGATILYRTGRRLFATDGTQVMTQQVGEIPAAEPGAESIRLVGAESRFYALANETAQSFEIWTCDGTPEGTGLVRRLDWTWTEPALGEWVTWGDMLFLTESGVSAAGGGARRGKLHATDGTTAGTFAVWTQLAEIDGLVSTSRGVVFGVDASAGPPGLYLTQGVPGETENLRPGLWRPLAETDADGQPGGEWLYLTGKPLEDTVYGRELWRTDWTTNGWSLVRDMSASGRTAISFEPFGAFGKYVFFNDGLPGHIWITDGTEAGTFGIGSILGDFFVNMGSPMDVVAEELQAVLLGNKLIVFVRGIDCVKPECCGDGPPEDQGFLDWLEDLLEDEECEDSMRYLTTVWESNGTREGTFTTGSIMDEWLWFPTLAGQRIFLYGQAFIDDGSDPPILYPPGLWVSYGTRGSTGELREFPCAGDKALKPFSGVLGRACSSQFIPLGTTDTHFFFSLREPVYPNDPTQDRYLWASDGSVEGTTFLRPLLTTDGVSETIHLTGAGYEGLFYFSPTIEDEFGRVQLEGELWRTDGTMPGTGRLMVVRWEDEDQAVRNLSAAGDYLFFTGNGRELWVSDGTTLFTLPMSYITGRASVAADSVLGEVDGRLVFSSAGNLWSTDGTKFGTMRLPDAIRGPQTAHIGEFTPMKDGTFALFTSGSPRTGMEMWFTDGTASGTFALAEVTAGPYSSSPRRYVQALGSVYFQASTPEGGNELYSLPAGFIRPPPKSGWSTKDVIVEFGRRGE